MRWCAALEGSSFLMEADGPLLFLRVVCVIVGSSIILYNPLLISVYLRKSRYC